MRIVPATLYPYDLRTPVVSLRLRADPRAPGRVRAVLREVFRDLMVAEEDASDGEVMASELATNALAHAPEPYAFTVSDAGSWLVCEMADGGPPVPLFDRAAAGADADPPSAGGRGLLLVRRLSGGRCGIRPLAPGKAVWFAIAFH